jgi:hypothetical protein
MEKFATGQEEDERDREFFEAMKEEKTVENVQGDAEADAVLTDFYIKPYREIDDAYEENDVLLPLYFYDNDDGFWTKHIENKMNKWQENPMITNRKHIKV